MRVALGRYMEKDGSLLILMYWNALLSLAQGSWHASEQECWGLVCIEQGAIQHFRRMLLVIHTDRASIARVESLPSERIDAKHRHWFAEIVAGSCLLNYRLGEGALHRSPDVLSRDREQRSSLNLACISDWCRLKSSIQRIADAAAGDKFDSDDSPLSQGNATDELPASRVEISGKRPGDDKQKCERCVGEKTEGHCGICEAVLCLQCLMPHPCTKVDRSTKKSELVCASISVDLLELRFPRTLANNISANH